MNKNDKLDLVKLNGINAGFNLGVLCWLSKVLVINSY